MDIQDVKHLAMLARLDIPEDEQEALLADLTSILGYIDQITKAPVELSDGVAGAHHNICRDDVVTNVSGANTATLLASAASTQDGFVKVRKIL